MTKLGNLQKRLNVIARNPEWQAGYEEGLRHSADEFAGGLRLLPIETQDQVIEAIKRGKGKLS